VNEAEGTVETDDAAHGAASAPGAAGSSRDREPYTSVVYVHGIGSQRRYEESSRLVDRLDRYLFNEHARGNSKGKLSNIKVRVEPLRAPEKKDIVGYIRTIFGGGPENIPSSAVRFYELYWAPVMADVSSPRGVLRWLFQQPLRPWQTAFSPWRERQRLRRSTLVALFEPGRSLPAGAERRDGGQLLKLYNDFEGLEAQRAYPKGTFAEFLNYVRQEEEKKPDRLKRHLKLAHVWRRAYIFEELRNAAVLSTLTLLIVLLAGGALFGTIMLLKLLVAAHVVPSMPGNHGQPLQPYFKTAVGVLSSLAGLLGVGRLLTDYLGDVEAWATYEETDAKHVARDKVLDQSMELLTHVLCDDACKRVVVVAHSLGTSIAHDALLALTHRNLARDQRDPMDAAVPLSKIDQFVTLGSPIDKIEYFFESYSSQSHRYKRVVEALRGDIGSEPFSHRHIPHVHWINFWDEGDAISGALQSPSGKAQYLQRIDNVHVATYAFPAPAASHFGYFENRTVISSLFEIIYRSKFSFWPATKGLALPPEQYEERCLGPGQLPKGRRTLLLIALAIPWVTLAGLMARIFGCDLTALWLWAAAAIAGIVLLIAYCSSRHAGSLDPI